MTVRTPRKGEKPKVVRRRIVGLYIAGPSRGGAPTAHAVYEEDILERRGKTLHFSTRVKSGNSVWTIQHSGMLNGTKKRRAEYAKAYRPDLHTTIAAAALLYGAIESACLKIDESYGEGILG
jgi:hypothetical protein